MGVPIEPTIVASTALASPGRRHSLRRLAVPLVALVILALVALIPGVFAPHDPLETSLGDRLRPPSTDHLFGTDPLGRDILSRVVYGTRLSMAVAAVSALIGGALGSLLGIIAGYRGGRVDALIMRLADISLGFPLLVLAVLVAALYGPRFSNVILILVVGMWSRFAAIARGGTIALRNRDFVVAARIAGTPAYRILGRHIAPHLVDALLIMLSLQAAWAVLLESGLSFFGVGIPPPDPSWGQMVADGREFVTSAWWVSAFPGLAIVILVLALNLIGDRLRDDGDAPPRAT
jgi:peptide/nickel transport system permease protein